MRDMRTQRKPPRGEGGTREGHREAFGGACSCPLSSFSSSSALLSARPALEKEFKFLRIQLPNLIAVTRFGGSKGLTRKDYPAIIGWWTVMSGRANRHFQAVSLQ